LDLQTMRHSTAHVMAAAVCRLFKDVRLDIGPATDDGFYYDFDTAHRFAPEDFAAIEAEMQNLVAADLPFERFEMSREDARAMLEKAGQSYKVDRLADIPEGEPISFYRCGEFVDLCRGPHVARSGDLKAFKLVSVAGSYFRGLEKNPMLQRLYGVAAATAEDLKAMLDRIEEARKRDHRKLGRELDLFSIEEDVGPGLIHWHPKAGRMRVAVEDFWRREHFRGGYDILFTPHIGRAHLWETSGHLRFFAENMYAPMEIEGSPYYIKPMNCPFHIQIYKAHKRSYRDLPLRFAEMGTVYRYEKSGVLNGLLRARGFTQDDAHIFCTPDQIEAEVVRTVTFALRILRTFGFQEFSAYLATRPADAPGELARWEQATRSLEHALRSASLPYSVDEGGGAFYGPKIDVKVKDALGREWQLSTIQFDFNLPERFDLSFVGEDGKEHRPYMVHRALLGSLERFFGILIEHYAGAFPLWLAPEQVRVIPITDRELEAARGLADELAAAGFRAAVDTHSEKMGAKIRRAQQEKIPYMAVMGGREVQAGLVAVRARVEGDRGTMPRQAFIEALKREAALP
jgi:threonyl-tRNA synthetase